MASQNRLAWPPAPFGLAANIPRTSGMSPPTLGPVSRKAASPALTGSNFQRRSGRPSHLRPDYWCGSSACCRF